MTIMQSAYDTSFLSDIPQYICATLEYARMHVCFTGGTERVNGRSV